MGRSSGLCRCYRRWVCLSVLGWEVLSGCSGTADLAGDIEGAQKLFGRDSPKLDIQAGQGREDDEWGIAVAAVYARSTLVFASDHALYRATSQLSVQLIEEESGGITAERTESDTIIVPSYEDTQSRAVVAREMFLPAPPGSYIVRVSLLDELTGKRTVAQRSITLPGLPDEAAEIGLLSLRMGNGNGGQIPVPSFRVAAGSKSLLLVVDVSSAAPEATVSVRLSLLRCLSDTSVATPPYSALPAGRTAPVYGGMDQGHCDTLLLTGQRKRTANHWNRVDFPLPQLAEGVYRMEVTLGEGEDEESPQEGEFRSRHLLVFSPGFPRPSAIDELIGPLVYLAAEEEWDSLFAALTPVERRRRFEAFWLSGVDNPRRARDAIRHYYSRVEEANLMFSSHKEGWKTDRGMVYIICGPPSSSESVMDNEVWYYPQGGGDRVTALRFQILRYTYDGGQLYEDSILQRSEAYRTWWENLVWRWRNGIVP